MTGDVNPSALDHIIQLDPIAPPANAQLQKAIEHLVTAKYWLDRVTESSSLPLPAALDSGGYGLHEPTTFYEMLFPFIPKWDRIRPTVPALVPTDRTLGCSWRWRTKHVQPDERDGLVAHLTNRTHALTGYRERAQYMWIEPLGLVLPHEGKNRVDFLRDSDVEFIPAQVTAYGYPAAERIGAHHVQVHGRQETWAVLDERWVQRLDHPEWVLPVLAAYGVKQLQWPAHAPSPELVATAFARPHGHADCLNNAVVDLAKLQADEAHRKALVPCAIDEIKGLELAPRFWLYLAAVWLIGVCTWLVIPDSWSKVNEIAAMCSGVAAGGFLAHCVRLHRAPRSLVEE